MLTVNIHEAKTQLSRLVEMAAKGEPIVIAKAGKPMVKVVPLTAENTPKRSPFGFMTDMPEIPDDFDTMFQAEIEEMFGLTP